MKDGRFIRRRGTRNGATRVADKVGGVAGKLVADVIAFTVGKRPGLTKNLFHFENQTPAY